VSSVGVPLGVPAEIERLIKGRNMGRSTCHVWGITTAGISLHARLVNKTIARRFREAGKSDALRQGERQLVFRNDHRREAYEFAANLRQCIAEIAARPLSSLRSAGITPQMCPCRRAGRPSLQCIRHQFGVASQANRRYSMRRVTPHLRHCSSNLS